MKSYLLLSHFRLVSFLVLLFLFGVALLPAAPVTVRFPEGTVHGFLVIHTKEGKVIASGDLVQTIHGGAVKSHLIFRFKDGSIDDEAASFSQRNQLQLISDHHVQKGPTFPHPMDSMINAHTGDVTLRYEEKGQQKVKTEHLNLPSDLTNGLIIAAVKNIPTGANETKLSYLAATEKPRIVKLSIIPSGEETFTFAGTRHSAKRFIVKIELGGVVGIVAPLVGKQPADTEIWVVAGETPAFAKSEGPLYLGGPTWTIEMTAPVWRPELQKPTPN